MKSLFLFPLLLLPSCQNPQAAEKLSNAAISYLESRGELSPADAAALREGVPLLIQAVGGGSALPPPVSATSAK